MKKLLKSEPQHTMLPSLMSGTGNSLAPKLIFIPVLVLVSLFFGVTFSYAQTCNTWHSVGNAGFSTPVDSDPSIAIDAAGTPYVVFADDANGGRATVMKYNGSSWITVGSAGFSAGNVSSPQIVAGSGGALYVVYRDVPASYYLSAMKYDGVDWIPAGSPAFSFGQVQFLSVAVDGSGVPYVAYDDGGHDDKATVMKYDGTNWVTVGIAGFSDWNAPGIGMDISPAGIPYVAFKDVAHSYSATVMMFNGSSWVDVGSPGFAPISTGGPDPSPHIAVDNSNVPYVIFPQSNQVMKYDGSSWLNITGATFPASAINTSIKIGGGAPYVTYADQSNIGKAGMVKYNGSSWEPVGTAAFSIGATLFSYASAIDANNIPYVAYYDALGGYRTVVMKYSALPEVIAGVGTVCAGSTSTLTDATTGGTWSSSTSIATVGSSTGIVSGIAAGVATITYTISGGCTATMDVTVNALPDPGSITGVDIMCETGSVTTLSSGDAGGVWSSSNTAAGTIASNGNLYGLSGGVTTISYTVTNGCGSASATHTTTVLPLPNAGTISGASTVNTGSTVTLSTTGSGGVWSSSNTSVATVGSSTGIVTGVATGAATISYTFTNSCGVSRATQSVTVTPASCAAWNNIGSPGFSPGPSGYNSLAADGSGTLYLGYADAANGSKATVMKYDGTSWVTVGSGGISTGEVTTVSLTIDGSGMPYVAFSEFSNGHKITVMKYNGTNWVMVGSAGFSAGAADYITLKINSSGTPYIGYRDVPNGNKATVMKFDGSSWVTVGSAGFSAGFTAFNSLALDASGTPYVAYFDMTVGGGFATVMKYDGTNWVAVGTPGFSAGEVSYTKITINSVGVPYIAYLDGANGTKVTVMKYNGTNWVLVGSAGFSAGLSNGIDLVIDGSGTPYVGYMDYANSIKTSVMKFDGSSWLYVGSVGFSPGTSQFTSMVIGAGGIPYITYQDGGNGLRATVMGFTTPSLTISGSNTVCVSATTTLTDATTGGTWSSSNDAIATIGSSTGVVGGITAGVATITYTISGGCTGTMDITVNPLPVAGTITGTATVCAGTNTTLSDAVTGGVWSSASAGVAAVGSTGVVTGVAAGNATISYTVTNSCGTAAATDIMTVNPLADPGTISGASNVNIGATTTFTDPAGGGAWSSSNPGAATVNSSGVVTGVAAGSTNISYSVTNSCGTVAATKAITVPSGSITTGNAVCVGSATNLSATITGTGWTSNNTSVATADAATSLVTGIAAGTVVISYTSSTGNPAYVTVTVKPLPPAISGPANLCVGVPATVVCGTGTSWTSSDPSVATIGITSGVITSYTTGTTTITYTATNACVSTVVETINAAPPAITGSSTVCTGSTTTLGNSIPGGNWTSSNTTYASVDNSNGVVTGVWNGTATITYMTAYGCKSTRTMTVNPLPAAITGSGLICMGNSSTLNSTTTGGTWSSANTAIATVISGVVTAAGTGSAAISYTLATGCARAAMVTVNAALPGITGTPLVCVGATATLSNSVPGGTWSSSSNPIATVTPATGLLSGISAGNATITYSVSAGCKTSTAVTVNASMPAVTGTPLACISSTTTLSNAASGGTWSSSNAALATVNTSGVVTGIAAGTPIISYVLRSGCFKTIAVSVKVLPAAISGDVTSCTGSTTTLTDASSPGLSWTSSNPAVATIGSASGVLTGVTTGTTTITYTATSGCYVTRTETIHSAGTITGAAIVSIAGSIATPTFYADGVSGGNWTSSNTAKATIGALSGQITGVSAGAVTISYAVSGCVATKPVTITSPRDAGPEMGGTDQSTIRLFPNPTTGVFTISSENSGILTVFTLDGKMVTSHNVVPGITTISLPNGTAAGVYLCKYNGDDGNTTIARLVFEP